MTKHVTNLRHECETDGCYRAELWDWTPFNDCFGNSGIRISDVDGIVERNGLFLMLDGKRIGRGGGRSLSDGQRRLYKQFAAARSGHVIVFHGIPPREVMYVREWRPGGAFVPERECDLNGLRAIVAAWFEWAEGMSTLPVKPTRAIETELHLADPGDPDWPEVAQPGGGIDHLRRGA